MMVLSFLSHSMGGGKRTERRDENFLVIESSGVNIKHQDSEIWDSKHRIIDKAAKDHFSIK